MKKHFNKELVMTNEDIENFESSRKCWICDDSFWWYFVEGDVRVIDHCQVNKKIIMKHCLTETSFVFHLVGKELVTKSINLFSKFGIIWNENDESLSRFVLKMRYFIVSWCIWKI